MDSSTVKLESTRQMLRAYSQQIIIGMAFLLTYVPTFIWMWDRWFSRNSYYTHGILVPLVSLFLIWLKREQLKAIKTKKSIWGLRLIIIGIVIHIFSSLFRVYFSSGFSMIIVLLGLILNFYGKDFLKKILFPISFLVFMIPLPLVVITNISFKMKIFAAQIAALTLNNLRIPAIREGSIIKMRHAYVIVDDVCSGLRSLISLTALGAIFSYWLKSGVIKKNILFLSTIPIAIITNVCRVIFLASIAEIWGPKAASGFVHDFSGFMIFGIAFVLLHAVSKLLE